MTIRYGKLVKVALVHTRSQMNLDFQIWNSNTGVPQLRCEGIIQSEADSILCLNLSEENSRLIASTTSGLVMVCRNDY